MAKNSYDLKATPNAYGFGRDWVLIIYYEGKKKEFWLGQGIKVSMRVLGTSRPTEFYGTNDFNKVKKKIARDLINTYLDKQYGSKITKSDLKKIHSADSWELAVE